MMYATICPHCRVRVRRLDACTHRCPECGRLLDVDETVSVGLWEESAGPASAVASDARSSPAIDRQGQETYRMSKKNEKTVQVVIADDMWSWLEEQIALGVAEKKSVLVRRCVRQCMTDGLKTIGDEKR